MSERQNRFAGAQAVFFVAAGGKHMFLMRTNACAALLMASMINLAVAQDGYENYAGYEGIQQAHGQVYSPAATPGYAAPGGQYPQLHAPLYPSPVQYTPPWNGGSVITNQAFAPHEMLYPHTYHAMYPPFYHKVSGKWFWTPFGVRQHEHWKLQGTEVSVKYRSQYPLFGGFHPPRVR
jgi:hypothetical protein